MPDHVLEAFALEPGSARFTGTLEVEPSPRTTLADAIAGAKEQAAAAWGGRPGYVLVREAPLAAGRLLVYREGAPVTRHVIAIVSVVGVEEGRGEAAIAVARAEEDESRPEAPLEASLGTLRCTRR